MTSCRYIIPVDRNGKSGKLKDVWSTEELEEAMIGYRTVCDGAARAVRAELQLLAGNLEVSLKKFWRA